MSIGDEIRCPSCASDQLHFAATTAIYACRDCGGSWSAEFIHGTSSPPQPPLELDLDSQDLAGLFKLPPKAGGTMSVDEDTLDQMVEAASLPSLAAVMQRAKDAGLITPVKEYGHDA